jgi:hypothetical protein
VRLQAIPLSGDAGVETRHARGTREPDPVVPADLPVGARPPSRFAWSSTAGDRSEFWAMAAPGIATGAGTPIAMAGDTGQDSGQ